MRKLTLAFIVVTLTGCSTTSIDKETELQIRELTGCENITTGWTTNYDSNIGTIKNMKITIHEPKNVDIENRDDVEALSLQVAANAFDELEKIDTTVDNVQIIFISGEKESTIDFEIDELFASLGMQYFEEGNHKKGISYLTQAIKIKPAIPKHLNNRASLFFELKQFNNALQDAIKAYELQPNDPERLRTIAAVYLELGNLDKAKATIEKTINMNPTYSSPYAVRARVFKRSNKLDSAANDFEKAISLDSTVNKWHKELSEVYLDNNELQKAFNTVTEYLKREDKDGQGYLLRGKVFLKLNKKTNACTDFQLAEKFGDKDAAAYTSKECKAQ